MGTWLLLYGVLALLLAMAARTPLVGASLLVVPIPSLLAYGSALHVLQFAGSVVAGSALAVVLDRSIRLNLRRLLPTLVACGVGMSLVTVVGRVDAVQAAVHGGQSSRVLAVSREVDGRRFVLLEQPGGNTEVASVVRSRLGYWRPDGVKALHQVCLDSGRRRPWIAQPRTVCTYDGFGTGLAFGLAPPGTRRVSIRMRDGRVAAQVVSPGGEAAAYIVPLRPRSQRGAELSVAFYDGSGTLIDSAPEPEYAGEFYEPVARRLLGCAPNAVVCSDLGRAVLALSVLTRDEYRRACGDIDLEAEQIALVSLKVVPGPGLLPESRTLVGADVRRALFAYGDAQALEHLVQIGSSRTPPCFPK